MSRESYDQIATVYSTDMGQSMAFDDVAYYRELCSARGGHSLELGCGTGRILLPLLKSGVDIHGIDQSPGMLAELQRLAAEQQLQPQTSLGTLVDFHTDQACNTILAPYAVLTYLTEPAMLDAFFSCAHQALARDGLLVTDTFIPRDVAEFDTFRLDYRRPHQDGILQREKRIAKNGQCNRIERRYTLHDADGQMLRTWTTLDLIRPWTEAELVAAAHANGFMLADRAWDFSVTPATNDPQFIVLHFQRAVGEG